MCICICIYLGSRDFFSACTFPVRMCPRLEISSNTKLSSEDVVYNTVVQLSCNDGYIFADNTLTQTVECTDTDQWNDSFASCIRMYNSGRGRRVAQLEECWSKLSCQYNLFGFKPKRDSK